MRAVALALCASVALGCTRGEPKAGNPEGAAQPSVTHPSPQGTPFLEGIEISLSQSGLDHGLVSNRFNFAQVRELWLRIKVKQMDPMTVMRLTFTTPTGEIFYESNVAYSPDARVRNAAAQSSPQAAAVFPAVPVNAGEGYALDYVVPVAGTALSRFPIAGTWHVEVTFQGGKVLSKTIEVSFTS